MEMTYEIFDGFLADAECCQVCWILVSGEWLLVTDWDDRYAKRGFLYCRCLKRLNSEHDVTKTLIRLSAIDAVRSDAP
uniref:Uncharacterized protein n=1 Tax=uncultured organism MedDCM-OCT-S09-C20 TaxID=743645 RepID=D6PKX2_9ZZZZ|nr:hypothetical protein [uncultured organism MedDCM-OCT-S09-C20]